MINVITGALIGFSIGFVIAEAMFKRHVGRFADMIIRDQKLTRLGKVYAIVPKGVFERMAKCLGIIASTKTED